MATSLREALESAVSSQEAKESSIAAASETAPEAVVETAAPVEAVQTDAVIGESTEQRLERIRDDKGRFAEGKAEAKAESKPLPIAAPEAAPAVERAPRPASWKPGYQADWDALTPRQQAYVNQRDTERDTSFKSFKERFDAQQPFIEAVQPFLPELQKHNIRPEQWITNLGRAHHTLATGDGQTKLQMFAKLAQDYGVPLQALYDTNFAQQFVQQTVQPQAPQAPDIGLMIEKKWSEIQTKKTIEDFTAAQDASGHPLYPHFETVKADMALLLDAGKARDLKTAYDMSLRLHDDLFAAQQAEKSRASEASRLEAQRKAVAVAKGSAVSVRSATPASTGAAPKGTRREVLSDAWDSAMAGRV